MVMRAAGCIIKIDDECFPSVGVVEAVGLRILGDWNW